MAIRHISYLDLSPEQRQNAATKARQQIRSLLMTNILTEDQIKVLQGRLAKIDKWERGDLPIGRAPAALPSAEKPKELPAAPASQHVVELGDKVDLGSKLT